MGKIECYQFAENLLKQRDIYQKDGVFPPIAIDGIFQKAKNYEDKNLKKKIKIA